MVVVEVEEEEVELDEDDVDVSQLQCVLFGWLIFFKKIFPQHS